MMHPQAFLDLAAELNRKPTQARCRTSISRSYQAAFLHARDFLQNGDIRISKGPQGHVEVSSCLFNSGAQKMKETARQLDSLRNLRNKADYCLGWTGGTRKTAEVWYQVVQRVFRVLDETRNGPNTDTMYERIREYRKKRGYASG